MKLIQIPNKQIRAYYSIDKHNITLYDSRGKFCDTWAIEPSILQEFPTYYRNMAENLGQYNTIKRMLESFMTDFDIVTDGSKASNVFEENGRNIYIKVW